MISRTPVTREPGFGLAVAALLIAAGSILYSVPSYLDLYNAPIGIECRPMGAAVAIFLRVLEHRCLR
jgi:hypothetical protein